jgi:geranylgeranyl pyrophosphate synthase
VIYRKTAAREGFNVTVRTGPIDDVLEQYAPYLQTCRRDLVDAVESAPYGMLLRPYFERGKMLRPLVVFGAAAAVGAAPDQVLTGASALELLHVASLIHDDIIDQAGERRGLPALHTRVGVEAALVTGDFLLLQAFTKLTSAGSVHPADRVLDAVAALGQYAQACCRGQADELIPIEPVDAEAAYLAVIERKTASQFAAAAVVGGGLGGAGHAQVEALRTYGLNLGMAFQIQDDVLDLIAEPDVLGKPVWVSLAMRRPSLPLIYLGRHASSSAQRDYDRLINDGMDRTEMRALLKQDGILALVETRKSGYVEAALAGLSQLASSRGVGVLQALAHHAAARRA